MLRRIVLMKTRDYLEKGWQKRSFAVMGTGLATDVKSSGVELDEHLYPVPVFGRRSPNHPDLKHIRYGSMSQIGTPTETPYAVVAHFDDQEAIERFKSEKQDSVIGVYADVRIEIAPAYCKAAPVGDFNAVLRALPMTKLRSNGITGKRVRVAVVDTGIHGAHPAADGKPIQNRIVGGYSPA